MPISTFATAVSSAARCRHVTRHPNTRLFLSTVAFEKSTKNQLRALLRETAQPVAVVTSLWPDLSESAVGNVEGHPYHGATLSSFTSIALDPYPLVSFALRVPSRMATSLKSSTSSNMVLNLLSAAQSSTAVMFSRPDLHPAPFSAVPYHQSKEGIPVLQGSLGAISCKLVSVTPLHDLDFLEGKSEEAKDVAEGGQRDAVVSELFIARVIRVEQLLDRDAVEDVQELPLIYHRRGYTSCRSQHVLSKT